MRNAKTYVPQLLCPQPTKESDQTAFFLRNALTLVPRNNLARYSPSEVDPFRFATLLSDGSQPEKRQRVKGALKTLSMAAEGRQ